MGWLIGFIFSVLCTFVFWGISGEPSAGAQEAKNVALTFVFLDAAFLYGYLKSRKKKKDKKIIAGEQQKKLQGIGAVSMIIAKHMTGLPIGEGAECKLYLFNDKVVFEKDANKFNLIFNKIIDVTVKTDVEIQKQYVSSIGGAVGGAVLFGPLGAMIGGRAKEKRSSTESRYLIYTYQKNDAIDYISFEVTNVPNQELNPYINLYKSSQTIQREMDL